MAGGACGGDIIFHELCIELNIETTLFLALSPVQFKAASVSRAGREWEYRFDILMARLSVEVMPENAADSGSVWERSNNWMLNKALKNGGENMTLLALWDGAAGDGVGGTEHLVISAQKENAGVRIINIREL